jgi:mannose-1-phosphate guanylyltransferase
LFCRADVLLDEIAAHMPDTYAGLDRIAHALSAGLDVAAVTAEVYADLPAISIDYGVMEKAQHVLTVPASLAWNDVGSWSALADTRVARDDGNVVSGDAVIVDAERNIVVCDDGHVIALIGVHDLVVVQSGDAILVVPKHRAQDVRDVVAALETDPNGKRHL